MVMALTAWVKNIVLVVLFAAFLELLLPSSSMQRFIRVVLGLFIMLAILNPVLDAMNKGWDAEPAFALSTSDRSIRLTEAARQTALERERLTMEQYRRDLARQIRATILAVEGVADARVAVEVRTGMGGAVSGIEKITIWVQPGRRTVSPVKPVQISGVPSEPAQLEQPVINKITRAVTELYQVKSDVVDIRIMSRE